MFEDSDSHSPSGGRNGKYIVVYDYRNDITKKCMGTSGLDYNGFLRRLHEVKLVNSTPEFGGFKAGKLLQKLRSTLTLQQDASWSEKGYLSSFFLLYYHIFLVFYKHQEYLTKYSFSLLASFSLKMHFFLQVSLQTAWCCCWESSRVSLFSWCSFLWLGSLVY